MLLTMQKWDEIRDQFSQQEKDVLNAAVSGETICPRGCILDEEKLGPELTKKIADAKVH